jgi:hypothetical protein
MFSAFKMYCKLNCLISIKQFTVNCVQVSFIHLEALSKILNSFVNHISHRTKISKEYYYTERRLNERAGREVAIIAGLAGRDGEVEPLPTTIKKGRRLSFSCLILLAHKVHI